VRDGSSFLCHVIGGDGLCEWVDGWMLGGLGGWIVWSCLRISHDDDCREGARLLARG
jgi:hypothetical protein